MNPSQQQRGLPEVYREVAYQWADANAAALLLEETKSAVLSEMIIKIMDGKTRGKANAEAQAKASKEWHDYLHEMVEARKLANRLSVEREYMKMKFSEWVSNTADERTKLGLQ